MSDLPPQQDKPRLAVVGPPPEEGRVRPRLIQELHDKVDNLEGRTEAAVNQLDDGITALAEVLALALNVQNALIEAVKALAEDPSNPMASAAKANDIMKELTEEADDAEGPKDNGVVPDAAGDQPGDA